jgi:Glycosyl transferase 4-like domain
MVEQPHRDHTRSFGGDRTIEEGVLSRMVVVSEFIDSGSAATAAGTRIRAIREFFSQKGWKVLLLVPKGKVSGKETSRDDGRVRRLTTYETRREQFHSPAAAIVFPLSLREYLTSLREFRPDIVVISGYSPFLLVEPLIVARLLEIPVVYDVLDSWILMSEFHRGRIRNWLRKSVERFALSRGNLVAGVTRTQLELLERRYRLNPEKLVLAPRGADLSQRSQAQASPDYDIIHIGPPREYYDNNGMLDFVARLSSLRHGLRVLFLGIEEGPVKARLERDLAAYGLSGAVDLRPPVHPSEVSRWTRRAKSGLIALTKNPLYRAAVSTKAYDYVLAGIPILFLGLLDSEQAEFVLKHGIGRVCETPEGLAQQTDALLSDDKALRDVRNNAEAAIPSLSWDQVLKPFYERVAALSLWNQGRIRG